VVEMDLSDNLVSEKVNIVDAKGAQRQDWRDG
jgi:hypothetical protein